MKIPAQLIPGKRFDMRALAWVLLFGALVLVPRAAYAEMQLRKCLTDTERYPPPLKQSFTLDKLVLQYDSWETSQLTTVVAAIILSERLGFNVKLDDSSAGATMYSAVADGTVHLAFEAWFSDSLAHPGDARAYSPAGPAGAATRVLPRVVSGTLDAGPAYPHATLRPARLCESRVRQQACLQSCRFRGERGREARFRDRPAPHIGQGAFCSGLGFSACAWRHRRA